MNMSQRREGQIACPRPRVVSGVSDGLFNEWTAVRYAIAGIILVDAAILVWAWRNGNGTDFAMMAFALVCVTFFGSVPVVLGVLSRRKAARAQGAKGAIVISAAPSSKTPTDLGNTSGTAGPRTDIPRRP